MAEAVGFVLALLTSLAAQRAWSLSRTRSIAYFAAGFGALALSQFAALLLEYSTLTKPLQDSWDRFDTLFWLHYLSLLAGYALIFLSFGRHPFRWSPALGPILLLWGPLLQMATLVFLFFVVLHAGLHHIARARAGSLQSAVGFFLLLVGQFLNLYDYQPLNPRTWYGELATLAGFLLLYTAVARPRRTP